MLVILKILLIFFTAVVISQHVTEYIKRYDESSTLVQDVLLKSDLNGLLDSLRRLVNYCNKRKIYIDVNLAFGLFLKNVNIKSSLYMNKDLPSVLRNELHDLLDQIDELMQYTKQGKSDASNAGVVNAVNIKPLLKELPWMDHLERFKQVRSKPVFRQGSQMGIVDLDWQEYLYRMSNVEQWTPNLETSDHCISSLINSQKTPDLKCEVSKICHQMLRTGTNFGYALTHRLLFLIMARSGHGCSIYSARDDKKIRHRFCEHAYEEAKFIAIHDYDYIDLLLEQIALCTLDGHSEFLHRSWLNRFFQHQAPVGCFGEYPQNQTRPAEHRRFKLQVDFVDGLCNNHITGVAAGTLGAAVRYIIEMYYE